MMLGEKVLRTTKQTGSKKKKKNHVSAERALELGSVSEGEVGDPAGLAGEVSGAPL